MARRDRAVASTPPVAAGSGFHPHLTAFGSASAHTISRRSLVGMGMLAGVSVSLFGSRGMAETALADGDVAPSYEPGTYTGQADGKFDAISVEVDFSESAIVEVRVTGCNDTARIAAPAIEQLPQRIVEAQGLGVDTVAGATFTSIGIINVVADCVDQAGGSSKDLFSVGKPQASDAIEEIEADVVVVGAGAAGMGAAIAAAQQGAHVVMLEKNANIGGNCLVSGGFLEYITAPDEARPEMTEELDRYVEEVLASDLVISTDPDLAEQVRQQYEEHKASGSTKLFDSPEFYALDYTATSGEGLTPADYLPTGRNIAELNEWMTELGFEWATPTHEITGYLYPRWSNPTVGNAGEGYFDFFDTVLVDGGMRVDVYLATPAISLVTEGGDAEAGKGTAVVGVNAEGPDGTSYVVRAPKVVLACGGFSGSPDLLRQYNTQWSYPEGNIPTTNVNGHTGDGIKMATELGAATADMGNQMLFPLNEPTTLSADYVSGTFADSPLVNKEGRRFVDETTDRFTMAAALMEQTDSLCFMVSDALSTYVLPSTPGEESLIEHGRLYRADTLEELAEQIGVPADTFAAEIERYNGFCDAGQDDDFGRYLFDDLSPVREAPFYASPATWAAHITIGGLMTDEGYQVLDGDGEAIAGLYACGEVRNGICGVSSIADGMAAGKALSA